MRGHCGLGDRVELAANALGFDARALIGIVNPEEESEGLDAGPRVPASARSEEAIRKG
jgi:hypothetical protein